MKSQNQITIYSLNDVVTQATAPANPYNGQLWVDTSKTPPVTMVYNGSKWVEQNGTDAIKTSVKTVEDKQAEFKTSLDGLTSTVGTQTKTIETVESEIDGIKENVTSVTSDISTLQQTTTQISADVSSKADNAYGSSSSSFGWKLQSSGFELYSNKTTVMKVTSSGLEVNGKITSSSGTIGGFTIDSNSLKSGTWGSDNSILVCTGTSTAKSIGGSSSISGWCFTAGSKFGVTKDGALYASNALISGTLTFSSTGSEKYESSNWYYKYNTTVNNDGILTNVSTSTNNTFPESSTSKDDFHCSPQGVFRKITKKGNNNMMMKYGILSDTDATQEGLSLLYLPGMGVGGIVAGFDLLHLGTSLIKTFVTPNPGNSIFRIGDHSRTGGAYISWNAQSADPTALFGSMTVFADSLQFQAAATSAVAGKIEYNSSDKRCYFTNMNLKNPTIYSNIDMGSYTMYFGSSSSYRVKIDSDQVTFNYGTKECGDLECYSAYVDVQGTWKTNGNSWISSSDRNLKTDINEIDSKYEGLFDKLMPITYKWKNGTSGRTHMGFIAQDVKKATEDSGMTTLDFAAYVHFDETTKNGETLPETCGIRYEEITPLNTWEIQKLKRRVKELERIVEELRQ